MIRCLLLLATMTAVTWFLPVQSWAQCPEDTIDLGICDTIYVEAWPHTDTCWGGDCNLWQVNSLGSHFPCFLYVNVFVTHDSNTFLAYPGTPYEKYMQDSIAIFTVPLSFWHQPVGGGDADSVIFPIKETGQDQWNNLRMDPPGHVLYSKSMFRHFVDSRTGDTVHYNRLNKMVNEDFFGPWDVCRDVDSLACSGDSGRVRMAVIGAGDSRYWWEGSREILYTMTFVVYMDGAETTEVCFDAQFWPPVETLSCVRCGAQRYYPRDNVPICFKIYADTVEVPRNEAPSPFSLLFPPNKDFIPMLVHFDWETAADPNPADQVRYDLYISTSDQFPLDQTVIETNLDTSEWSKGLDKGIYFWKVKAKDNWGAERWSNQIRHFIVTGLRTFLGDLNEDGSIDGSDVVFLIDHLYKSGPPPDPLELGDVNCDQVVNTADVVYLINYLFKGGPLPCD